MTTNVRCLTNCAKRGFISEPLLRLRDAVFGRWRRPVRQFGVTLPRPLYFLFDEKKTFAGAAYWSIDPLTSRKCSSTPSWRTRICSAMQRSVRERNISLFRRQICSSGSLTVDSERWCSSCRIRWKSHWIGWHASEICLSPSPIKSCSRNM